jgi:hypothetical protein
MPADPGDNRALDFLTARKPRGCKAQEQQKDTPEPHKKNPLYEESFTLYIRYMMLVKNGAKNPS